MSVKLEGFDRASKHESLPRRIIANIEGMEKTGKTNFSLTAPGPIAFLEFDVGTEGVIHKFAGDKEILRHEYRFPPPPKPADYMALWMQFKAHYTAALGAKEIRTVVVDTGTEMWELIRLAYFGKLTQVMPHHYGPVNAELRSMLRLAFDTDKNLLLVHKLKEEYIGENRTGGYERAGFKDVPYIVQMNLRTSYDSNGFHILIKDCRQDMALSGMILDGPMCNFDTVLSLVVQQ